VNRESLAVAVVRRERYGDEDQHDPALVRPARFAISLGRSTVRLYILDEINEPAHARASD